MTTAVEFVWVLMTGILSFDSRPIVQKLVTLMILWLAFVFDIGSMAVAQDSRGFDDPQIGNGSMLLKVEDTWPSGLGEPLNLVISNRSDSRVLRPTMTQGGLYNYFEAFSHGGQCLGLHMGNKQVADLGDGQGNQTQINMLRYQYFSDPFLGTCLQSMYGGSHFRLFQQMTSGAYFLSSSIVRDVRYNHALGPDSYDLARDHIVGNITGKRVVRKDIKAGYVLSGTVEKRGWRYTTTVDWDDTLLPVNRTRINHYANVQVIGANVTDGYTAILTVEVDKL